LLRARAIFLTWDSIDFLKKPQLKFQYAPNCVPDPDGGCGKMQPWGEEPNGFMLQAHILAVQKVKFKN
jgi:hypothetical protein